MAVELSKCLRRPALVLVFAGMALSCVDVRGGAVEFSWTIRTEDGGSCNCARADIDRIELTATPCDTLAGDGTCVGSPQHRNTWTWSCSESHGTTHFDIPEGRWGFEIEAFTLNGLAAQAAVPPPIVRDVVSGEVAMLDALLITTVTCRTP